MKNALLFTIYLIGLSSKLIAQTISIEDRIYGLSKLWKEMEYNFAYMSRNDSLNLDTLYKSYLKDVIKCESDYEYYKQLQRFCATFHEGHTFIVYPQNINKQNVPIPIKCAWHNNKVIIISTASELTEQIPVGSQILKIDSIEIKKYLETQIIPFLEAPAHVMYQWAMLYFLQGENNTNVQLTIKQPDGVIKDIRLTRGSIKSYFQYIDLQSFNYEILEGNISYFKIGTTLNNDIANKIISKYDSIKHSKAIILDFRNCFGGSDIGSDIGDIFTDSNFVDLTYKTRINNAYKRAQGAYSDKEVSSILGINSRHKDLFSYFNGGGF